MIGPSASPGPDAELQSLGTAANDSLLGQVLADRYRLVALIGQGGMGRVYRAEDSLLGNVSVAVKLLTQLYGDQTLQARFEREAQICAQLSQKSLHIVRVTNFGITEHNVPFYVMEYLDGKNLRELILHEVLTIPRFLALARQICAGLHCAHTGVVVEGSRYPVLHRDLKPSNILVVPDTTLGELVKILDFGIAKFLSEQGTLSLQTTTYIGTLAYSSPEQMQGLELDARSDIYSLGVILYEMLTGTSPLEVTSNSFAGWYHAHRERPPRPVTAIDPNRQVSPALETLVMACLRKRPEDRPQSVAAILEALKNLDSGPVFMAPTAAEEVVMATLRLGAASQVTDSTTATVPMAQPPPDRPRSNGLGWFRWGLVLLVTSLLGLGGLLSFWLLRGSRLAPPPDGSPPSRGVSPVTSPTPLSFPSASPAQPQLTPSAPPSAPAARPATPVALPTTEAAPIAAPTARSVPPPLTRPQPPPTPLAPAPEPASAPPGLSPRRDLPRTRTDRRNQRLRLDRLDRTERPIRQRQRDLRRRVRE